MTYSLLLGLTGGVIVLGVGGLVAFAAWLWKRKRGGGGSRAEDRVPLVCAKYRGFEGVSFFKLCEDDSDVEE